MSAVGSKLDRRGWSLLLALSVLWGVAFAFVDVALRELPPLSIVLASSAVAVMVMLPIAWWLGLSIPRDGTAWRPFLVMALLNSVLPQTLMAFGQLHISGSLGAVINATTPLFSVLVMAATGDERLQARRLAGVVLGAVGVAVLQEPSTADPGNQAVGVGLFLAGAFSYALAGLWGRRRLALFPPVTSATCQQIATVAIMVPLAGAFDGPAALGAARAPTWWALAGLGALSTALAYVIFFDLLARAGATNVLLVTLLVPVTAMLVGYAVGSDVITARQLGGAALIGVALVVMDGRLLRRRAAKG